MQKRNITVAVLAALVLALAGSLLPGVKADKKPGSQFLGDPEENAQQLISQGQQTFRFDTFGDEAFWTGQLHIQQPVSGLSPRTALSLGLKVDSQAISPSLVQAIEHGSVNLDDPAVTRQLIKANAVLGVV